MIRREASGRSDEASRRRANVPEASRGAVREAVEPGPEEPPFAEPWEAHAFGLVEILRERGLIDDAEWTAALAEALTEQDAARGGADYYRCWLTALERLLVERDILDAADLEATTAAWRRAAHATPHGHPILLENDPGENRLRP